MTDAPDPGATVRRCTACGTGLPATFLVCPACHRLVYAEEISAAAAAAAAAESSGDDAAALAGWKKALLLLPAGSRQRDQVSARVAALEQRQSAAARPDVSPARAGGWLAKLGVAGLLLWKLKAILLFLLTKGKLLVLAFTKGGMLFSLLLSFGVLWTAFGWKLALGLVVTVYVHELGHVYAFWRVGIPATAPMFVPGLGAFVRGDRYPASAAEQAQVGLAGPLWGLGAALAAAGVWLATDLPSFAATARLTAWINLLNLLPVWQLDGARGFRALSRGGRLVVAAATAATWALTREGLLVLLFLVAAFRALAAEKDVEKTSTPAALVEFVFLVAALGALSRLPVPGVPGLSSGGGGR